MPDCTFCTELGVSTTATTTTVDAYPFLCAQLGMTTTSLNPVALCSGCHGLWEEVSLLYSNMQGLLNLMGRRVAIFKQKIGCSNDEEFKGRNHDKRVSRINRPESDTETESMMNWWYPSATMNSSNRAVFEPETEMQVKEESPQSDELEDEVELEHFKRTGDQGGGGEGDCDTDYDYDPLAESTLRRTSTLPEPSSNTISNQSSFPETSMSSIQPKKKHVRLPQLPDNFKKILDKDCGLFSMEKYEDGKVTARCNICPKRIKASIQASSNLLTHYKTKHLSHHKDWIDKKTIDLKRNLSHRRYDLDQGSFAIYSQRH